MAKGSRRTAGAEAWLPLSLDGGLFANLDPDVVIHYQTAMENAFVNELGGNTRFPGLTEFATLPDNGRVYLFDFEGDMIAATSKGFVYRVTSNGAVTPCTGVSVSGGKRVIMAKTNQELLLAAGGPIVRLRKTTTELLANAAPDAAYVGWIDGFAVAPQVNSYQWQYSSAGVVDQWPALNIFSANSNPENVTAFLITPVRSLLFCGPDKIEQFERLTTGTNPFFKRFAVGDGVKLPYCILYADNAIWTISSRTELVKLVAGSQIAQRVSDQIGLLLEDIDDWTDAWIGGYPNAPLNVIGQKFILIQFPNATNEYGTKGLTLVYDYRSKKFFTLYGWDSSRGVPTRWPGWSHWPLWNEVFVGGEGKIYKLTPGTYQNDGTLQRWLIRTSHVSQGNELSIKNFRLQLKRGVGGNPAGPPPQVRVRCRRDARSFGPWISRDLGVPGDNIQFKEFGSFGIGTTFMWEIMCADNCPVNLVKAEVKAEVIGH
jgi:hypothetical protein